MSATGPVIAQTIEPITSPITVPTTGKRGGGGVKLQNGLISYWEYQETTNHPTPRADSAGTNTLTTTLNILARNVGPVAPVGTYYTQGQVASLNDIMYRDGVHGLGGGTDFTYGGWSMCNTAYGDNQTLVSVCSGGAAPNYDNTDYAIRYDSTNNRFNTYFGNTTAYVALINNFAPTTIVFFFFILDFDASAGVASISFNNGTATSVGGITTPTISGGRFTQGGWGASQYATCGYDMHFYYDRVLKTKEREALWNNGDGLTYAQLVAL